jgi:hypothetical protein
MLPQNLNWFFVTFSKAFRQGQRMAFEVVMFLSLAHFFGCYNPNQLAAYLGIAPQHLYRHLKDWSLYRLKKLLFRFMVRQAAERLKPILEKSDATRSRAGLTLSVDNSVIDRLGRLLRCTWSWYSGRAKQVVNGQDLLGIVLTIGGVALPVHLVFCSKQGRKHTDKPSLLVAMFRQLIEAFAEEGIDLTRLPITMDSWFASQGLREALLRLGFHHVLVAGKSNYSLTIGKQKHRASTWKKTLTLIEQQWGVDIPSLRVRAHSPTFGSIVVLFFEKSTTRIYYLMDLSDRPLRAAEIWHVWKQHVLIEHFWKQLKSTFKIKDMRLQGDGLYAGLAIKILAYLLAIRLKRQRRFSNSSLTQILRTIQREHDLTDLIDAHFHLPDSITQAIPIANANS